MSRLPLRVTLVAALVGLAALGLVVTGVSSTAVLRGFLLAQADQQLVDTAGAFGDRPLAPRGDRPGLPPVPRDGNVSIIVLNADGSVQSGGGSDGVAPAVPAWTVADVAALGGRPVTLPSVDGSGSWRAVAVANPSGSVVLALNLATIDATVRRLVGVELVAGAIVLALLALLGTWLVRRALRPLAEVEATASAIAAGDLSRRVPPYPGSTEVGSLASSFNSMIERVEVAFRASEQSEAAARSSEDRMRQFVADASHELRTPLTSIRGYSELYWQGGLAQPAALDRAMGRIGGEAERMGGLVEGMLLLARHDAGRPRSTADVDLAALARDSVDDARVAWPGRAIEVDELEPCVVVGEEAALRALLTNLVANALQHTAGPVRVSVDGDDERVRLRVADDGPGLTVEQAAHAFDRFYRAEADRSRASGGSGLGLAIVSAVVADHGGTVELDTAPERGTTAIVTLPRR